MMYIQTVDTIYCALFIVTFYCSDLVLLDRYHCHNRTTAVCYQLPDAVQRSPQYPESGRTVQDQQLLLVYLWCAVAARCVLIAYNYLYTMIQMLSPTLKVECICLDRTVRA